MEGKGGVPLVTLCMVGNEARESTPKESQHRHISSLLPIHPESVGNYRGQIGARFHPGPSTYGVEPGVTDGGRGATPSAVLLASKFAVARSCTVRIPVSINASR